jgi:AI-2 transport protein TqsA
MGTEPARLPATPPAAPLFVTATVLVAATLAWFMLKELGAVLRPLLIAVLLAYVLLPYHTRLKKHVGTPVSLILLAGITVAVLLGIALTVQMSVTELTRDWPQFQDRLDSAIARAEAVLFAQAPGLMGESEANMREQMSGLAARAVGPILNTAAAAFLEACVVGLYLLFLLLEGSQFPSRVRKAYAAERAEEILDLAGQVNAAIVSYLKAKVKSSFILAAPVGIILQLLGVKFALLWAVLTFFCNFVPYLGSVTAWVLPVGFAALQLDPGWRPIAVAILLLGCQAASASFIEPMLLGQAVGLSPLVILISLAFWGLLWGISGMLLAVPLTVVPVIVMNHFSFTRPVAKLVSAGP